MVQLENFLFVPVFSLRQVKGQREDFKEQKILRENVAKFSFYCIGLLKLKLLCKIPVVEGFCVFGGHWNLANILKT